jgi:hypothetical protein
MSKPRTREHRQSLHWIAGEASRLWSVCAGSCDCIIVQLYVRSYVVLRWLRHESDTTSVLTCSKLNCSMHLNLNNHHTIHACTIIYHTTATRSKYLEITSQYITECPTSRNPLISVVRTWGVKEVYEDSTILKCQQTNCILTIRTED